MPRYQADPRWITTRFPSKCHSCGTALPKGARAYYYPNGRRLYGEKCCDTAERSAADFNAEAFDDAMMEARF